MGWKKLRIGIFISLIHFLSARMSIKMLYPFLLPLALAGCLSIHQLEKDQVGFDGEQAYQDVVYQLSLGPRIPGSQAHQLAMDWMIGELESSSWQVEIQSGYSQGKWVENLIASRPGVGGYLLLGAHYDNRIYADQDPDQRSRTLPVPGANDGASGVAVLLELARVLPEDLGKPVKLVFFDAEDNGGIDDWEWLLGSRYFVEHYRPLPEAVVVVDMVGDSDLQIYYEYNSTPGLLEEIWDQAQRLGYSMAFIPEYKHSMLDDHTPFVEAGISAVDLIDFNYPYWHTTQDTADKVSADSLEVVGNTLLCWILDWK
jgi:glutaminyl-peptide cyclotransferase